MLENKRTLNAEHQEPADASSSQEDYLTKSEGCKTAMLFSVYVRSSSSSSHQTSFQNASVFSKASMSLFQHFSGYFRSTRNITVDRDFTGTSMWLAYL